MVTILVTGSGAFASRMLGDFAAYCDDGETVVVAGRNNERLEWLRQSANARATIFGRNVSFATQRADLRDRSAVVEILSRVRPDVVVQSASDQSPGIIAGGRTAWDDLVGRAGLSATAIFQTAISRVVATAIVESGIDCAFINCSLPDVVNGILKAMGLPILCGVGNVAILGNMFADVIGRRQDVRVLAHYQNLSAWRQPAAERAGTAPRVWVGGEEEQDVFERFASVKLTREPVVEISGASGVPLMVALASKNDWTGHLPGFQGLPGGYPVRLRGGILELNLPETINRDEAVRWNSQFEMACGVVVDERHFIQYTGKLRDMLGKHSSVLTQGFHVDDFEGVYQEMTKLREKLN